MARPFTIVVALTASLAAHLVAGQSPANPASDENRPAVIKEVKVFLPYYSGSNSTSCKEKLKRTACQAQIQMLGTWQQASAEMETGKHLLDLRDYANAKQHCIAALQLAGSKPPDVTEKSMEDSSGELPDLTAPSHHCIDMAEDGEDEVNHENLKSLVGSLELYLHNGDLDRAKVLHEELRKRYADLPAYSLSARKYATEELANSSSRNWSTGWAWVRSRAWLLLTQIFLALGGILWLYLLLKMYRGVRNFLRRGRYSRKNKIRWFVQSIKDEARQAGAGAVMDALSIEGNALLRNLFSPPALLLVPPGFGGPQGGGVWWDLFGDPRPPFEIESLPRDQIERHEFVLDEALEEIKVKIAGQEVSGIVGLAKNVSRWFNQGTPTVQGAILKVSPKSAHPSWAVRLTASSGRRWLTWSAGPRRNLTASVYSSTEEQEFIDAIGLAAQRAAFKLFYRLAEPNKDPDEITAVAALHQGIVLLRRYL